MIVCLLSVYSSKKRKTISIRSLIFKLLNVVVFVFILPKNIIFYIAEKKAELVKNFYLKSVVFLNLISKRL